ncbi:hypothetical protein U1701_12635 [Sphingomonas sp. PB2P19]|uniref:hypothetical protein n=1 Tax=Sphingomonas rhamnosi TaxID=3096156 RepID=UPI002FC59DCE
MFKTMWNMPAKLLRTNDDADDAPVATGSLEDMIKTAEAMGAEEAQGLIIACVGRDRPITWPEIRDLRHATADAAEEPQPASVDY